MNDETYYLSIQSRSLPHYIEKALILPSRFYRQKPSDIQSIESDYLILSRNKFLNNSNCAIEIILNEQEIEALEEGENKNIFLYKSPIPMSRIKKIFFIDEVQKLKTIDNIQRGVGFMSEKLLEIVDEKNLIVNIEIDEYHYSRELESKIQTYNHILGGLAFVRYTTQGEYSKNYLSINSYFNKSMRSNINNRVDKYDGAFTHSGSFWSKLSPLIYEDISEKDVLNFAQKENMQIEKQNGIFKYEDINSETITYKLAILNVYGEDSSKRKTTNDLISDCKNEKIPQEKQEGIALIFGINNGYSAFRNKYDKKIVKFEMNRDDYYTIESVFQYVINDKKDNAKFEYLDKIFSDKELTLSIPQTNPKEKEQIFVEYKEFEKMKNEISEIKKYIEEITKTFKQKINEKDREIRRLHENQELKKEKKVKNKFDEEQEIINIQKDLEKLCVKDLKSIAREQNIKGRSKMKKVELIEAIKENDYIK